MPDWTKIYVLEELKLDKPILVQGLPGLGFVGKLSVSYLIDELKLKKFAELHSSYLTLLDGNTGIHINPDGTFFLPKFEFYARNESKPHIVFLTGDTQPNVYGQHEVADKVLDYAQKLGSQRVIAVGGFQTPVERDIGSVYAVYNRHHLWEELKNFGVKITQSGAITGACGIILGMSDQRNFESIGLLGATKGEYPDMEAAKSVLQILSSLLKIKVDLTRLNTEIEEMKNKLESLQKIQTEAMGQIKKELKRPTPFYI